jgi:hypothetical protein
MLVLWHIWAILGKAKFVEQWAVVVNVYWGGNVNPICADVNPIRLTFCGFCAVTLIWLLLYTRG